MRRLALVLGLCLAAAPARAQNAQGQLSQLPAKTGPLGGLVVECVSGCGSGGVGAAVDISSVGGTVVPPGGPISVNFTNTSLAVTNAGIFAVQAAQSGVWNIGSITTLPAITFASPQAVTQSGGWNIGTLTSITNPVAVTGTFFQATQPVSGTFWQATQPVSGTVAVSTFPDNEPINLAQVGGAATSLGQKTSANAIPVVLPSDALPAPDRATTGSITAPSQVVSLISQGTATATLVISGTWVGTHTFFGIDGAGAGQPSLKGINLATGALEGSATANGIWLLPTAGWSNVGVTSTAWTSGTSNVAFIASPGSNVVALSRSLPAGTNLVGGILSNVPVGITAPSAVDVIGGMTNDPTPQYQPLPLGPGGQAVQVVVLANPRPGLPKPTCNAVLRTNCSPKGF